MPRADARYFLHRGSRRHQEGSSSLSYKSTCGLEGDVRPFSPQHDASASLLTHNGEFLYTPAHLKQFLITITSPGRTFRIRDLHRMKSRRLLTWRKTSAQYPRCCLIGLTECPGALKPFSPPLGRGSPAFGGLPAPLASRQAGAEGDQGMGGGVGINSTGLLP